MRAHIFAKSPSFTSVVSEESGDQWLTQLREGRGGAGGRGEQVMRLRGAEISSAADAGRALGAARRDAALRGGPLERGAGSCCEGC